MGAHPFSHTIAVTTAKCVDLLAVLYGGRRREGLSFEAYTLFHVIKEWNHRENNK
jgi:hypothetical protein